MTRTYPVLIIYSVSAILKLNWCPQLHDHSGLVGIDLLEMR